MGKVGKTKRTHNEFSRHERGALLVLVKKYEKFIEKNENTAISNFDKNKAWNVIYKEFYRAFPETDKDLSSLRSKYSDIKKSYVQNMKLKYNRQFDGNSRGKILDEILKMYKIKNSEICDEILEIKQEPMDENMEIIRKDYAQFENRRDMNYTNYEKFTLLKLANKYRNVVLNTGSDSKINSEKQRVWDKIASEFRKLIPEGALRSSTKLRYKLADMKKYHRRILNHGGLKDKNFYLMQKLLNGTFEDDNLQDAIDSSRCNDILPPVSNTEIFEDTNDGFAYSIENSTEIERNGSEASVQEQQQYFPDKNAFIDLEEIEDTKPINVPIKPELSMQEQYFLDKNRREEEEHKFNMEILRIRAHREQLETKFRIEEHELRKASMK